MLNEFFNGAAPGGVEPSVQTIERSLRFNSGDSSSLSQVSYSGSGTFSCWVKRAKLGAAQTIITNVAFAADDTLNGSTDVFRDPSAWMHIVVSTNGTYVNGTSVSTGSAVTPSAIGSGCDLYLAEVHFVDAQALVATDFGFSDSNGVWQPKAYAGTYGTNGFHLDFSDNTNTTTIAEDSSGNNNDWTANNISVTSGVNNDSLIDSPTNYTAVSGNNGGNYATLNPVGSEQNANAPLTNGNLEFATSGYKSTCNTFVSTIAVSSGKWYFEGASTFSNGQYAIGIIGARYIPQTGSSGNLFGQFSDGYAYEADGGKASNNNSSSEYGSDWRGTANLVGCAFDADNGTLEFFRNGTSQGVAFTGIPQGEYYLAVGVSKGGTAADQGMECNFGQRPFAYTPPTGYVSLCTANLPAPTIADGSTAMDVKLYTGNGSTQTINGLGFSPDLVWIKNREQLDNYKLLDTVRGATNELESTTTDAEVANTDGLTAFNSDGFNLGADVEYNTNTESYVAWTWDAGSSTVSNTDGSITSSVRANPSTGFSICTFTQPSSSSSFSWGHGLNVAPQLVLMKPTGSTGNWQVYHASTGAQYLWLNTTSAATGNGWSTVDSSIITANATLWAGNFATVAYCFAPVEGYSAFGTYTGNASTDGPFVYTGMTPRFVWLKRTDSTGAWVVFDTARSPYNFTGDYLQFNWTSAEINSGGGANEWQIDILSNGFKLRTSGAAQLNANGGTFVWGAFAEHPFKTARAR